jgi:hypothetical protein
MKVEVEISNFSLTNLMKDKDRNSKEKKMS